MQVVYEFTTDPQLLEQYYQLREQCYREELKLPDFNGAEEPADRNGRILIARNGDLCLGGARITSGTSDESMSLSLNDLMPELGLQKGPYCMWERLSLSKELREYNCQKEFCAHLVNASWNLGYDYAFMVSSIRNARFYRLCHSVLDVTYRIFNQVKCTPKGTFSQLEHVLSAAHLSPVVFGKHSWDWRQHQTNRPLPYGVAA